jgi:hypothetical protein
MSKYAGVSHRDLWNQLQAGDPGQIDGLATSWKSMADTARTLSSTVTTDLGKLDWDSNAGREFQRRLSVLSSYSTDLAHDHDSVHTGLTQMSQSLRTAKGKAEDPADTDDNDSAIGFAAAGSVLGPGGTVLGGLLGHHRDEEQKKEAHERMVAVVAGLAADYDQYRFSYIETPAVVPVDLPGPATNPSPTNPASGPGAANPHGGPGTHAPGTGQTNHDGGPTGTVDGPGSGTNQPINLVTSDPTTNDSGTSLLGAGGAIAGAGAVGAGGLAAGGALAGQLGALPGTSATGLTAGLASAGMPAGGLVSQPTSPNAAQAGGRSATGNLRAGSSNGSGNGTGRAASAGRGPGSGVIGEEGRAAGARRGGPGSVEGNQRGGAGRSGEGYDDEEERYDTWLTEDEMVWGDDPHAAPPSVLGGPRPELPPQ